MLRNATGETCHHDAVAGTSTDQVTNQFIGDLQKGVKSVQKTRTDGVAAAIINANSKPQEKTHLNSFFIFHFFFLFL